MNRKSTIALVLVSLALVPAVVASPTALAGSPLLSGYGGPGAGEQAVIGSTLIGGSEGGAGSGGSSDSTGSGGSGAIGASTGGSRPGSTATGGISAGSTASPGSGGNGSTGGGGGHTGKHGSTSSQVGALGGANRTQAFVYPTALRSASVDSPALGISGSDLLLFLVAVATLALVAVATVRLSRLQR